MTTKSWHEVSAELLGGISHALGTRISTVASVAQFLQADTPKTGMLGNLLEGEVGRLESILTGLRILAASGTPDLRSFSLEEVLSEIRALIVYHPEFREGLGSVLGLAEMPAVHGDVDAFRRDFLVALVDAGEGEFSMSARLDGAEVVVSVQGPRPGEVRVRALRATI